MLFAYLFPQQMFVGFTLIHQPQMFAPQHPKRLREKDRVRAAPARPGYRGAGEPGVEGCLEEVGVVQ